MDRRNEVALHHYSRFFMPFHEKAHASIHRVGDLNTKISGPEDWNNLRFLCDWLVGKHFSGNAAIKTRSDYETMKHLQPTQLLVQLITFCTAHHMHVQCTTCVSISQLHRRLTPRINGNAHRRPGSCDEKENDIPSNCLFYHILPLSSGLYMH